MNSQTCCKWYYSKAIAIFLLMALFLCFEMALQVSPGVMAAQLREDLQLSAFGLGIMSGVYFVTYTVMQIPSGLMYDRANFRVLVTSAILICALGTAIFGQATGLLTGALARLFMGFGSAFAFLSVLTVAARYFPAKYFAVLTGLAQLLAAIGGIVGNLPIAWSTDAYGWRNTLSGLAVIGLILAIVIWIFVKGPKSGQPIGEQSEPVGTTIKQITHQSQTWYAAGYAFLNWAPVTAFASLWGVPYLTTAYGFTTTEAGSLTALIWLGIGVTSPFIGGISDMIGRRKPMLIATSLLGAIAIACIIYIPNLSTPMLGVLLFVTGMGSSGQILSFAVVKDFTPDSRISTSIGFNNMAVVASGVIVQPLIGRLLSLHSGLSSVTDHSYNLADFHSALFLLPIFFVACVLLTMFLIRETYCGRPKHS